jgi:general secretion pathway protein E
MSRSLFQDGRQRVLDGLTSLDELLRVTRED